MTAMNMPGILEIRYGGKVVERPLGELVTTLGRSDDNEVVLKDDLVSRHHAKLEWSEGVPCLTDLGSNNGTLVNGGEIEPRVPLRLKEGDVISIGSFTLTVRLSPAAERPPLPAAEARHVAISSSAPSLVVATSKGAKEFALTQESLTIGRDPGNDIVIDDSAVSRRHAKLQRMPRGYEIADLGSTNGLTFESARISERLLGDGDVLWVTEAVSLTYKAEVAEVAEPEAAPEKLDVKGRATITIGRSEDSDVVVSHPAVSRRHARIVRREPEGTYVIEDLGSSNGTFVNGERVVQPRPLKTGDTIRVGPMKLVYSPEVLEGVDESRHLRVDAIHLKQFVSKEVNLLQDISLGIEPQEFVAVVGGSGAGKSTLLKALNGFNPASHGSVLINGDDLSRNFDAHRAQFGYVPQEDIIHKELTVYEALNYSAQLRLPADTTSHERRQRIDEVLKTLDLTERKDLPISKLSGGQLKRVSIGVELLTKPGLFCLDEATSGLDPGIEAQMMRLLRKLSDQGQTILLVTHATKNVMLCDKVIFLARGGYLAYYGPPDEALDYFGVEDFDGIYEKLERELTPKEWGERYRQSAQYQEYVEARLPKKAVAPSEAARKAASPGAQVKRVSALRQFFILSRRNINILVRDRASLILMLLLGPLLGSLFFVFMTKGLLDPVGGNAVDLILGLFMVLVFSCMAGILSSMREIVKEADIYRRERMVVLKIGPYVLSKLWVAALLAVYQAAVFLIFLKLASDFPSIPDMVPVYITLLLTIFSLMLLGLLVSAISPNANVTPLLVLLVLAPHLVFAGIIPLNSLGVGGKAVAQALTPKWAFESLVTVSGMGKNIANDPCWQMPKEERDRLTEEDKEELCTCMGSHVFQSNFPGILDYYHPAVDEPEPAQPADPGDPPPEPSEPASRPTKPSEERFLMEADRFGDEMEVWQEEMEAWEDEMDQYTLDIEAYQNAVDGYTDEMDDWQDEYEEWKEKRTKAIGEAEGVISGVYDDYGETFSVNLASQWRSMGIIMAVVFLLILGAMKLKDRKKG